MSKILFKLLCISLTIQLSIAYAYAITSQQLIQIIECKANPQQYRDLGFDYDDKLKKLGWNKFGVQSESYLELYKNKNSVKLFGRETNEIALHGSAIFALYRSVNVRELAQQFNIPEYTEEGHLSVFRGVKHVHTIPSTAEVVSYRMNLNLSEIRGKDSFVLLGCSYEPDAEEMEKFFEELKN